MGFLNFVSLRFSFQKNPTPRRRFEPPNDSAAKMRTEKEDPGRGKIRQSAPICIFAAVEGDSEPNATSQAGQSLLRIDLWVEMVTPQCHPGTPPASQITDYIFPKKGRGPFE